MIAYFVMHNFVTKKTDRHLNTDSGRLGENDKEKHKKCAKIVLSGLEKCYICVLVIITIIFEYMLYIAKHEYYCCMNM